jgi:uncharacterized membrane protein required for colicin V production
MLSLTVLFWVLVVLFAMIGAMRGWAKEILVVFSVILGLFLIILLETYVPFLKLDSDLPSTARLWIRVLIIGIMAFFGYQSPNLRGLSGGNRFVREKFQDALLGFILGALNGYLIFGSIWYFIDYANYPYEFIIPPDPSTAAGQAALDLLSKMPPVYLVPPWIYFAVAISFLFVVVVFL